MLSVKNSRIIARTENIVLVDFSREPHPPAPRFPGANGLRGRCSQDSEMGAAPLANPLANLGVRYAASGDRRPV